MGNQAKAPCSGAQNFSTEAPHFPLKKLRFQNILKWRNIFLNLSKIKWQSPQQWGIACLLHHWTQKAQITIKDTVSQTSLALTKK